MCDHALFPDRAHVHSPWIKLPELIWPAAAYGPGDLVRYTKNTVIYYQNSPGKYVYLVREGRVNLSIISDDGAPQSLCIADQGCLFGEVGLFSPSEGCEQASAVADCELVAFSADRFEALARSDARFAYNSAVCLARKLQALTGQIEQLAFNDAPTKIKNNLIFLAQTYGRQTDEGCLIDLRFTHQELGSMASVSRVTTSSVLSAMLKAQVIGRVGGRLLIPDFERLLTFK